MECAHNGPGRCDWVPLDDYGLKSTEVYRKAARIFVASCNTFDRSKGGCPENCSMRQFAEADIEIIQQAMAQRDLSLLTGEKV